MRGKVLTAENGSESCSLTWNNSYEAAIATVSPSNRMCNDTKRCSCAERKSAKARPFICWQVQVDKHWPIRVVLQLSPPLSQDRVNSNSSSMSEYLDKLKQTIAACFA